MQDITKIAPDMPNSGNVLEGVSTAAQPRKEDLQKLGEAGYKTVLDLRTPAEDRGFDEPDAVRRAGMEYVNLPVSPDALDDDTFDRFREFIKEPDNRPVLVHCSSATRVGALLLPHLILDEGSTREEAVDLTSKVGLANEELRRRALRYVDERQ